MKLTFPLALTFLTIIPWPRLGMAAPQDLARSMFWFPWVGALLGLLYWCAFLGLLKVFPPVAASALLLILTAALTRGLHLDGLADTLDGLGGGKDPAERLAIMKDSRLGAFGAIGLVLALLAKFACFLAAAEKGLGMTFILFPVLSRAGMVLLAWLSPYARPEGGLGRAMTEGVSRGTAAAAVLSALALALGLGGFQGVMLLFMTIAGVGILSMYFLRRLGGITGDVLGAANEVLEILVLAGSLALAA